MKNQLAISLIVFIILGFSNKLFPQGKWDALASLQSPPNIPAVAAANGKLYVMSGTAAVFVPTYEYDPSTDTWSQKAAIPQGCFWSSAVTVDNKIYVMGGGHPYPGKTYNQIYDPQTDTWSSGADLLTPRMYHQAVALNGKIYLMGGQNGDGTSEWYFEEYDPKTDKWTTKSQLPHNGAWYCGAAGVGDYVYRIAGGGSSNTLIRDWFDEYNTTNDTWTSKTKFHKGLHAPATVVYNDNIYLLGGYSNYVETDSVWTYNTTSGNWSIANFMLREPRVYHKAVVIDSFLYIYGGQNYTGTLSGSLTRYNMNAKPSSVKNNPTNSNIEIFPNPISNYINIETKTPFNSYVITNIIGQSVKKNNLNKNEMIRIDVRDLNEGLYILTLFSEKEMISKKFQVSK